MAIEKFCSQEYIAACAANSEYVRYLFVCDGITDNPPASGQYDVYEESNGWPGLQIGFGLSILADEKLTGIGLLSGVYYHPCNETHSVTVPKGTNVNDLFPLGYIVHKGATDISDRDYRQVRIWTGNDGRNIHCTRQLNTEDIVVKNPS